MEGVKRSALYKFLIGLGVSLIMCLGGVLLLAVVVTGSSLSGSALLLITEFIKILAIFIGCFFGVRGKKGWLKGSLMGVALIVLSYILLSIISLQFSFNGKIFIDILFGGLAGLISGSVAVAVKNK